MASSYPPKKNTAFTLALVIRDADGDPVTGATALDSERSLDGAAFGDCTNEATEIGTTGIYTLALTAPEMNADLVVVQTKTSTSGAKTAVNVIYTSSSLNDELATAAAVAALNDVSATDLLDAADAVETGVTPRQAMRLALAVLAGKLSGGGTATEVFRNAVADAKDRVTATVDAAGNRTAIATDLT